MKLMEGKKRSHSKKIREQKMSYETPSKLVFQNRKQFHASQKLATESTKNWFKRLQRQIKSCKFKQLANYLLIDKFVSGLSETDFETMSTVPTWKIDDLILVVVRNSHLFDSKQPIDSREEQQNDDKDNSLVKVEPIIEEPKNGGDRVDALLQDREKRLLTPQERKQYYIARLKKEGKFEEYKRKHAEAERQRRLKAKNAEHLLAPELQIHLITQRRKADRDKVRKRRQQQKLKKNLENTERNVVNVVWLEHCLKIEPEIKVEPLTDMEQDLEFPPADVLAASVEHGDETQLAAVRKPQSEQNAVKARKKRTYECYLCPTQYETLNSLKEHLKNLHAARPQILKCHLCDKTTINRQVLTRHIRRFHLESIEYTVHRCPCCTETFEKARVMGRHVKQMHPEYKPFVCELCGFSTKANYDLLAHMRVHTGRKDFECEICGRWLATKASRNKHMEIHTGVKNYPCQLCDTHFRQKSTLQSHLMCVHGQGEKPFVCDTCGKRFKSKHHLKIHSVTHTGDRPYKCVHCGKTFTQHSSMKFHVKRTHGTN